MYIFGGTVDFLQNQRSAEMVRFNFPRTAFSTLSCDLHSLLGSKDLGDVQLTLPGKTTMMAHACILAARSPELRRRLKDQPWSSAKGPERHTGCGPLLTLNLGDLPSAASVRACIRFIYANELTLEDLPENGPDSILPELLDIYDCACRLRLRRLELLCTHAVHHAVSVETVLPMLEVTMVERHAKTKGSSSKGRKIAQLFLIIPFFFPMTCSAHSTPRHVVALQLSDRLCQQGG